MTSGMKPFHDSLLNPSRDGASELWVEVRPVLCNRPLQTTLTRGNPLSFYIRTSFANGAVRFGVTSRASAQQPPDQGGPFSTGAEGEYRRQGKSGLFFADEKSAGATAAARSGFKGKFRLALTPAHYVMIGFGTLLVLLGLAVLLRKGLDGIVEILIGAALIATPFILTAKRRRELNAQKERERAEREAEEARNREMVGAFASRLQTLRERNDAATLEAIRSERVVRDIPYPAVAGMARDAVTSLAFRILTRFNSLGPKGVAAEIDAAVAAVGLTEIDAREVKLDFYRRLVWHLLADDRLTDGRERTLIEMKNALGLTDDQASKELSAIADFRRLRGISRFSLPQRDCSIPLKFQEACYHQTTGNVVGQKMEKEKAPDGAVRRTARWIEKEAIHLFVTSKRLILQGKSSKEIPQSKIYDLELDADNGILTIGTDQRKHPVQLRVSDPIYTAAVLDMMSSVGRKEAVLEQ